MAVSSEVLQIENGQALPLLALLLSGRGEFSGLSRQLQRFLERTPDLIRQPIKPKDLFELTTRTMDHYGRLSQVNNQWLDREMQMMFASFSGQFDGPNIPTMPLADELAGLVRRRMVSPGYGVEFEIGAASPSVPMGEGILCQDIVVSGTDGVDPFTLPRSKERARIIPVEPLFLFPEGKGRHRVVRALEDLTGAFADALESVCRPIGYKVGGRGVDIETCLPFSNHFSRLIDVRGDQRVPVRSQNDRFDPFAIDNSTGLLTGLYGEPLVLAVDINGNPARGEYSHTCWCNLAVTAGGGELTIPAGDLLLELLRVAESRFVPQLRSVQERAAYCAEMFVGEVCSGSSAIGGDVSKVESVRRLGYWIYGTWIAGLLMLWREKFSDPTAAYLGGSSEKFLERQERRALHGDE